MKPAAKRLRLGALLVLLVAGGVLLLFPREPFYRGRPVSHWAADYSKKLYPSGTAPLTPSQRGLDALRDMGAQKAATAMVRALMERDSRIYAGYRALYPKLPRWYQSRFRLRLTSGQRATLILGASDFLDSGYQAQMVPYVVGYLEQPSVDAQVAACELLGSMPGAASNALPVLNRLSGSSDASISQAAQAALSRITPAQKKQE